uniref:TIR domain-containing protein n=1 Tax=Candidatus Kentrum sp. UNK TaxID=2126344 RepID=A0A451AVR5_9GAMM|nr:MAG: TIR domain-containing protein [Candidatus Kentron sp. UNK]VFK70149.1 MAG: TIR domain-containing protein [Candidatus Kentron sp. UNK]
MKVFISYRRDDTRHAAARVAERLNDLPGIRSVFIDVDGINPGSNFELSINLSLEESNICLVMIGDNWVASDEDGKTARIFNDDDYVRLEITTALSSGKRVLPILVDGATMPEKEELPSDIQPITILNALFLRHDSFSQDIETVEDAIFGRKTRTPITRFFRRHPYLSLTSRTLGGVLLAGALLIVAAIIHDILTGGLALDETLGSTAVVWMIIIVSLVAGGGMALWFGIRR